MLSYPPLVCKAPQPLRPIRSLLPAAQHRALNYCPSPRSVLPLSRGEDRPAATCGAPASSLPCRLATAPFDHRLDHRRRRRSRHERHLEEDPLLHHTRMVDGRAARNRFSVPSPSPRQPYSPSREPSHCLAALRERVPECVADCCPTRPPGLQLHSISQYPLRRAPHPVLSPFLLAHMRKFVEEAVRCCPECILSKSVHRVFRAPLCRRRHDHVLRCHRVRFRQLPRLFASRVLLVFGICRAAVVDAASKFRGHFSDMCNTLGLLLIPLSRGNHQGMKVERFNRYLNLTIKCSKRGTPCAGASFVPPWMCTLLRLPTPVTMRPCLSSATPPQPTVQRNFPVGFLTF